MNRLLPRLSSDGVLRSPGGNASELVAARRLPQSSPLAARGHDLAHLLKEEHFPPPYIIEGIVHAGQAGESGSIVFLGGNPNVGKTWAALHMLASVGRGEPWFGVPTKATVSGGIFLETPLWMLQERLRAICKGSFPEGRVYIKTPADLKSDFIDICDPDTQDLLIEHAVRYELGLLVLDPFAFIHRLDENVTASAIEVGAGLKRVARSAAISIVLVDHLRKRAAGSYGGEEVVQALRGSIAKSAFASGVIGMDTHQGLLRLKFAKVVGGGRPVPIYLVQDLETGVLRETVPPPSQTQAREDREESIRRFLSQGPRSAKDIGAAVQVEPNTITKKYVRLMGLVKVGQGKNVKYRLPDPESCPTTVRESPEWTGEQ